MIQLEKTRVYLTESLAKKDDTPEESSSNLIGVILSIIGFFIITIGFVAGGYFSVVKTNIDILIIISVCLGSFIIGLVLVGIGQVIKLLDNIKKRL